MRTIALLVFVSAAFNVRAAANNPWPRESADAFMAGCTRSIGSAARYFSGACNCFLKRAQLMGSPEEMDRAATDPKSAARVQKVLSECLDAETAGFERMLRDQEREQCIDKGMEASACSCMTRRMRERWPRFSAFSAFLALSAEERKAERRKWALQCRAESASGDRHQPVRAPVALASFNDGGRRKFSSRGHPKANGIHLTMDYPSTWNGAEGERPHVLHKATGKDENGLAVGVVLIINKAPPEILSVIDSDGVDSVANVLFSDEMLTETAESQGGKLLRSGRTRLEGQPAAWFVMAQTAERAGFTAEMRFMTFQTIYKGSLINVQFSVGAPQGKGGLLAERFEAHVPLFQLIANSLVFQDRYK